LTYPNDKTELAELTPPQQLELLGITHLAELTLGLEVELELHAKRDLSQGRSQCNETRSLIGPALEASGAFPTPHSSLQNLSF
jgi:hypothetical protein